MAGRAVILIVCLALPTVASAAAADGHARFGPVLFGLATLVLAAKLGGLLIARYKQPPVLGELLVGIGLGNVLPLFFGAHGIAFVRSDPTLMTLAEMGVLLLLFDVGLEADLRAFARVGASSVLVALIGVVVPFGLGWGAAAWLLPASDTLVHVFIGATLTATSVGITARVLKDLGVTTSREGQIVLGAAVLDDILGLIVLAVVGGMVTAATGDAGGLSTLAIAAIFVKAIVFLVVTVGLGHWLSGPIVRIAGRTGEPGILLVFGVALCFALAFVAELVGLAGIIGAFAAGLLLDPYGEGIRAKAEEATLAELLHPLSSLFVPLFFVLMGMQVDLASLADPKAVGLGAVLIVGAVIGKLACAAGVITSGTNRLAIAFGMVPRGEVGLIFAGIGTSLVLRGEPLLSQAVFSAVVMMVLVTTLIAPVGLRWAFGREAKPRVGTSSVP